MEMNKNNFLRWEGQFAGAMYWTLSYSLLKNETCTIPASTDYFTKQPSKLGMSVNIYTNEACTVLAPDGWYSDGIFNYQVTGGIVVNVLNCEG